MPSLTVSGNEITDAVRTTGTQGDGRAAPDSSYGIYPAATNMDPNGGFETNTTGYLVVGGSITQDATQHKFGTKSGVLGASSTIAADVTLSGATAGLVLTRSFWVYAPPSAVGDIFQVQYQELGGAFGVEATGNGGLFNFPALVAGWQRFTRTITIGRNDRTTARSYYLNATHAVNLDGCQMETGAVATPYIETSSGTATRAICRVQAASVSVTNPSQGGIAQAWRLNFPSTDTTVRTLVSLYKDANNYCRLYWDGTGHFITETMDAGVSVKATSAAATFSVGATRVIIGTWTSAGPNVSDAGAAFVSTGGRGTPFTAPTTFDVGSHNGAQLAGSDCFWTATLTGTVGNADATAINAQGATDPLLTTFPAAVGVQAVMPFNTALYSTVSAMLTGTLVLVPELTGTVTIT